MTDYEIDKLYEQVVGPGPQSFHPNHRLAEPRNDVGVVKFKKPVIDQEKRDEKEVDTRMALYPNVSSILPNHLTFKYFEPSKDIGP